ncbi:MAG: hypothetical protein ABIT38_11415, partial [Gemmatimonadaceae bacterium]
MSRSNLHTSGLVSFTPASHTTESMRVALLAALSLASTAPLSAQRGAPRGSDISTPISELHYEVTFDRAHARSRTLLVTTQFTVGGRDPVLLSLPAWTPGAYELSNFARSVSSFAATGDGKELRWDKLDFDTWRVMPNGSKKVTVTFDFRADSLDNAMSWSKDDFAFFNGTNLFLYPEGRDLTFPATVKVSTESDWNIITPMPSAGSAGAYSARNYHDLVDMPFYVGSFTADSAQIAEHWVRLASYPASQLTGEARAKFWEQLQRMLPPMITVFGEVPFDSYTTFVVFDES